jgi:hypothetical protein
MRVSYLAANIQLSRCALEKLRLNVPIALILSFWTAQSKSRTQGPQDRFVGQFEP